MDGSLLANDLRRVISLVDLLRDIGLGSQLSLPKVVVLGNQSSGKSSLLEQIVGLDFLPRGAGVVTRRPLELRMNSVADLAAPYAEFDEVRDGPNHKKRFTNFNEVRKTINDVTDAVCGKSKDIVDKPIVLNVFAKSCPNLTMVDLPGITSIPVGDQPQNIYEITKKMALRYIQEKRSIILCVIPANQDLTTSQALKILLQIDPRGERSIGCLTKIDIMNRGDDATKMLLNKEVPLRYGYVGIKNRCQEDVTNNIPVEVSLQGERRFFTTSPIYSSLPAECFGTESLTRKLTGILYQQIKASMPEIFDQIKRKKKDAEEELQKLGPAVASTDAELVHFAWNSISNFMRIFKNSINGIRNNDYASDSISSAIREELSELYRDQFEEKATRFITEKDIEKAIINFDTTIPGFPSIDAFLALLNPLLKNLQGPAYDINVRVHQIMEKEALAIIGEVMTKRYPEFNTRFGDLVRRILDKFRRQLESYLNSLLDWELSYLYTNDLAYLLGDFNQPQKDKKNDKSSMVYELRKRIDAYYNLVVRNLRDLVPKQVFNFLVVKSLKELQFEAFQFTNDANKLKEWFNEPAEIFKRRQECQKAIIVFNESQKKIRMDPDISKLLRNDRKISVTAPEALPPLDPVIRKMLSESKEKPETRPREPEKPREAEKPSTVRESPAKGPQPVSKPIPQPVIPPFKPLHNPAPGVFGTSSPPPSEAGKLSFDEFITQTNTIDPKINANPLKPAEIKPPVSLPPNYLPPNSGGNAASKGKLGPNLPPPPPEEKKKTLDRLFGLPPK